MTGDGGDCAGSASQSGKNGGAINKGKGAGKNNKNDDGGNDGGDTTSDDQSEKDCPPLLGGDFGLKVMLRKDSVDIESLEKDGSMKDGFAAATQDSFYGMKYFEQFADMFKKEEATADYAMTGFGANCNFGGVSLGMVNFSKPPTRKKIVFFGSDTEGPYKLKSTGVIPGTEKVEVGGGKLASGAGYEISYTKGELTFDRPIGAGERVLVEYEIAGGVGGDPGKFSGFRIESGNDKDKEDEKGLATDYADSADKKEKRSAADYADYADGEYAKDAKQQHNDNQQQSEKQQTIIKLGPLGLQKMGATFLSDEVISHRADGNSVQRLDSQQKLFGPDGALSLWNGTKVSFEAASSQGNKSREVGRHGEASFHVGDSKAVDGNPMGPYNLDDTKLPIIEGSDEVRLNGELLKRDEDYTLDLEYGTLRLKNKQLNLSEADVIEATYRYQSEADALAGNQGDSSGIAGLASMENEFGGIKHKWTLDRRGADFMLIGGRASNDIKKEDQEISWGGKNGLSLSGGRSIGESLQDRSTWLVNTSESTKFSAAYEKGAIKLNYSGDNSLRYDNLAARKTNTEKTNRSMSGAYKISKKYNFSFDRKNSDGTDLRGGAVAGTRSESGKYRLEGVPFRQLKFSIGTGGGRDENESGGKTRAGIKRDNDLSIKFAPGKKIKINYDTTRSSFENSETSSSAVGPAAAMVDGAGDPDEQGVFQQSATATSNVPSTGNREDKWQFQYAPSKSTSFAVRSSIKSQKQINGATDSSQWNYDFRRTLNKSSDIQLRYSATESERPGQSQSAETRSVAYKTKKSWFDGIEIALKHDEQKTRMNQAAQGTVAAGNSGTTSDINKIGISFEPFWKKRKVTAEYSIKESSKSGSAISTAEAAGGNDGEVSLKVGMEVPFIKESYIKLDMDSVRNSGSRSSSQTAWQASLNVIP